MMWLFVDNEEVHLTGTPEWFLVRLKVAVVWFLVMCVLVLAHEACVKA